MTDEPKLEISPLSQRLSSGGSTVNIEIYRLEGESEWVLEIVDEYNNSTVWDDPFESDSAALTEAKKSVLAERVDSFIGPEDGKGSGNWN
ncbi:MAG: hypothetical protein Alis3KO_41250 [Aliiglaciecola sp.]